MEVEVDVQAAQDVGNGHEREVGYCVGDSVTVRVSMRVSVRVRWCSKSEELMEAACDEGGEGGESTDWGKGGE
jgi:hypothetical protein